MTKVLLCEDDAPLRTALATCLRPHCDVIAADGPEGLRRLELQAFDAIISDVYMPEVDGFAILAAARRYQPMVPVYMMSGRDATPDVVRAMREGARDFLRKPMRVSELAALFGSSPSMERRCIDPFAWRDRYAPKLVGTSSAMRDLLQRLSRVAPSESSVLIHGESGVGKELVAHAIAAASRRARKPMLPVNCAVYGSLAESDLFGHVRGAYTDARSARDGHFVKADGGTLFLDEVAELGPPVQARLLRALECGEVMPVGADVPRRVDVRVLAATHRTLARDVDSGRFRDDLRWRLAQLTVVVPPLRARIEDLPELIERFTRGSCERNALGPLRVPPDAMEVLRQYPWPGNVRELRNVIEALVVFHAPGIVEARDVLACLPPTRGKVAPHTEDSCDEERHLPLGRRIHLFRERAIREALARYGGSHTRAAEALGISRPAIHYWLGAATMRRARSDDSDEGDR